MYGYTHIKCILHLKCPVTESYVDVGKENMIKNMSVLWEACVNPEENS